MDIKTVILTKTVKGLLGDIRVTTKARDDFDGEWQERTIMRELEDRL
jgi:hypothetical protein